MNSTTKETRRESYEAVLPKVKDRARLILETLGDKEMTVKMRRGVLLDFFKLRKENKQLKADLQKARKEAQKYKALYIGSSKPFDAPLTSEPLRNPKRRKVPYCSTCRHHERVELSGRVGHRCVLSGGRRIAGNEARTSPNWCPLRNTEEVIDNA